MAEINQELAALRQEVAALRSEIEATDDWAGSVFVALELVLPFLLRGHPQVEKVRDLLHSQAKEFEELQAQPHLEGELRGKASRHEAGKMLYYQLALLGVWPGVDPQEIARRRLERAGWQAPAGK
jgi:hypothetical protein